jgi:hypothetical protein
MINTGTATGPRIKDQPAPAPNAGASMHDLVAADLDALWSDAPDVAKVRTDLADRKQVGLDRYGTTLQAGNGRDALVDAYQEALDLIVYLRQALAEAGWRGHDRLPERGAPQDLLSAYVSASRTAVRVRRLIETDRPAREPG